MGGDGVANNSSFESTPTICSVHQERRGEEEREGERGEERGRGKGGEREREGGEREEGRRGREGDGGREGGRGGAKTEGIGKKGDKRRLERGEEDSGYCTRRDSLLSSS